MHPLIENNREAIAKLCALHGVSALEAFGSILREDFDAERSDVDVLVEFDPSLAASFANFLSLKEALEALFARSVDLVELRAVRNRRLRRYIEQSKSPIYDQRDPGVYLEDIEYNASAAVRFISGYSVERYLADEKPEQLSSVSSKSAAKP